MKEKVSYRKYFNPFQHGSLQQILFRLGLLTFFFACTVGAIQNYLVGVNPTVYFVFLLGFVSFFIFYSISFRKDVTQGLALAFLVLVGGLIAFSYFFTGGITGSTPPLLIAFVLFGFLFFDFKKYIYYVVICVLIVLLLYSIQYFFPEWINPYQSVEVQEQDVFATVLTTIVLIGIIMYFFKKHYDTNQVKLVENQEALEGMNQLLRKVSDEALSATKAKSDFLASMSHEIRTPLHGIIGMADIIKKTNLNEEQIDIVNSIQTSGNILLGLINDILDISKIEAERFELSESKFDIRKTLHDVLAIVRPKTSEKNVDLTFTITKNVPKFLVGDEKRLKQVLLNIAGNAAKFTNRGFVHIEMKAVDIKADIVMLEFNVVDSGIGISEENIKYLFDPFFQGERVRQHNYGGTGLGLAITQKIVDLMKGKISVKSTEKLGTTFTIILPFAIDHSVEDTGDNQEQKARLED
ncbi:MAG: ATP-binding protein, partial [Bacteroidota bacterium]